jgi:hypothetical protein
MCNERYLRRRREADESREIWQDFMRTRPHEDPAPPVEVTDPEPTEVREAIAASEQEAIRTS